MSTYTYTHHQTGCIVIFPGDDGSSVTVQHLDGRHIGDFRNPRIGAVAAASEWASDSDSTAAIAAVEAALVERYAATMDPSLLAHTIRVTAGLD